MKLSTFGLLLLAFLGIFTYAACSGHDEPHLVPGGKISPPTPASQQTSPRPQEIGTLFAKLNLDVGERVVKRGSSQTLLASFVLYSSPSAASAAMNSITLDCDANFGLIMSDLTVMVKGKQFGKMQHDVNLPSGPDPLLLVFSSDDPIIIPGQNGSVVVEVYGNIATTSQLATYTSPIDFAGWTATNTVSGSAIAFPSQQSGQYVVVTP